jgi:hypothetical protein
VDVTVPAQTTCVLPNDPCSDTDIPFFSWKRFKCNASAISALSALIIGFMTIVINRNVRRGQIAHDQVQTLLEIDNQLIERPELWAVHGAAYLPKTLPAATPNLTTLLASLDNATPEQQTKAAEGIAAALGIPTVVAEMEKQRRRAFAARYFNFFDILYASYGPTAWNPWRGTFNEDWQAWERYMRDFFKNNKETGDFWDEFSRKRLYSESFINFIEKIRK